MPLFSRKSESECVLAFDIGSGSVSGAIVLITQEHLPNILYSFRSEIPFQEKAVGGRLLSLMLRSLSQVVLALYHEGFMTAGFGTRHPRVKKILVSLGAPWTVSLTTLLSLQNKAPIAVTEDVLIALLKHSDEEESDSAKHALKGGKVIEKHLLWSALNGYRTFSPFGKVAKEAEFAIFRSFSAPRVIERVSGVIGDSFHAERLRFHAFDYVATTALRKIHPQERSFIFVDVSGEQTEAAMVHGGAIAEVATFPLGKNHVIRLLSTEGGLPPSGAETFLRLSKENAGVGRTTERVKRLLERAQENWKNAFEKMLAVALPEPFLPRKVFITADEDVLPVFSQILRAESGARAIITPWKFLVTPISVGELDTVVQWNAPKKDDVFIGLVSSFARDSGR